MCCSARPTCIKLAITIAADLLYLSHSAYRLAVTIAADPLRDRGVQLPPVRGDSMARGDSMIIAVQAQQSAAEAQVTSRNLHGRSTVNPHTNCTGIRRGWS